MLERWIALTGDERSGRDLLSRYDEGHRGYHNLHHLSEVLAAIELLSSYADDLTAVLLAAYWHDAVYDPRAPDNEERSAQLAEAAVPDKQLAAKVARLVRLTASHDPAPDDHDGAVLCDADLAILAAPAPRYGAYVAGVRTEYGHVEDTAFATGRAALLTALLTHPTLFHTPEGQRRWERPARANVAAELMTLTGVGAPRHV